VIGNSFGYEVLQAVAQGGRGALLATFDELLEERLVEATETGYRFKHAMIRQIVYAALVPERRAWLHEQVARALEARGAAHLDEQAAILAFHYEHAGYLSMAFRYLLRAGDWARGAYATREAQEHYDHAFVLYGCQHETADAEARIDFLKRRSHTYLALSNFDAAIGDLEQLLATYGERGMRARAAETLYELGFAHYLAHRLVKAAVYLARALAAAEALEYVELRARALRLRDILNSTQGLVADNTLDVATDAAAGTDPLHAEEYWGAAMLAHLHCDFTSALQHARPCVEAGEAMGNIFLTLGDHFILGMSHANLGEYQCALDSLHQVLKLSDATGDRFWRARLCNTLGWIYRELFDLEQALQCDQSSLESARRHPATYQGRGELPGQSDRDQTSPRAVWHGARVRRGGVGPLRRRAVHALALFHLAARYAGPAGARGRCGTRSGAQHQSAQENRAFLRLARVGAAGTRREGHGTRGHGARP